MTAITTKTKSAKVSEIERIELQRFGEERDDAPVLAGFRQLRGAIAKHGEGARAIGLLHADLREAAISAGDGRELGAEVAELLLGLMQPSSLQLAQAGRERDLVVEVLDRCHRD